MACLLSRAIICNKCFRIKDLGLCTLDKSFCHSYYGTYGMKTINSETFLSKIWPSTLLRNETLELRAIHRKDKTIKRKFLKSREEFLKAANSYGEGWDIYFGLSTRYLDGGKKADCYRVNCVWVDLDKTDELPDFGKVPPDIIVNSGGGFHVYWLLDSPAYLREGRHKQIEAVTRALSKRFGGDMTCIDVSRILRVPDLFNYKYIPPRKVVASAVSD